MTSQMIEGLFSLSRYFFIRKNKIQMKLTGNKILFILLLFVEFIGEKTGKKILKTVNITVEDMEGVERSHKLNDVSRNVHR